MELGGGGLLRWIKNELIWNWGGGLLRWIKNQLIWNLGGLRFFSTHAFHIHTHAIQIRLVALCVSKSATKNMSQDCVSNVDCGMWVVIVFRMESGNSVCKAVFTDDVCSTKEGYVFSFLSICSRRGPYPMMHQECIPWCIRAAPCPAKEDQTGWKPCLSTKEAPVRKDCQRRRPIPWRPSLSSIPAGGGLGTGPWSISLRLLSSHNLMLSNHAL